jgi:hypothetical protein
MAGDFKGDRAELGPRLQRQKDLGLTSFQRQIRAVEEGARADDVRSVGPVAPEAHRDIEWGERPLAAKGRSGPKGGRPGLGEPWKALGISRAAYFRRKKGGGG